MKTPNKTVKEAAKILLENIDYIEEKYSAGLCGLAWGLLDSSEYYEFIKYINSVAPNYYKNVNLEPLNNGCTDESFYFWPVFQVEPRKRFLKKIIKS